VRRLVAAAVAALALSACQDPAGVGLGLIDDDLSNPKAIQVPLADLDTLQNQVAAIGIASASAAAPQSRVLVGSVTDATFGDAQATAYIDFLQPTTIPSGTEASDVRSVWLELRRNYVYGDTTTALPVEIRPITDSWDADTDYPSDTTLAVGAVLTSGTVVVSDTLKRFDLPASWVAANAATLIGSDFATAFEGFALQTSSAFAPVPGAVFGFGTFSTTRSGLRVALSDDTLFFPLSEVFSSITSTPPPAPPASVLPVRATSRSSLRFVADVSGAPSTALARATFRIPLDTTYAHEGTFVRPLASSALLIGVREDSNGTETRSTLGALTLDDGDAVLGDARAFTAAIQQVLIGTASPFVRYEVVPIASLTTNAASLNILPVVRPLPGAADSARLILTVVGSDA